MPLPSTLSDLSLTAGSNYPSGSDSPSVLDDVQRQHATFIAQIRDGVQVTNAAAKTTPVDADYLPINDSAASGLIKKLTWLNLKTALSSVFQPAGSYALSGANADITALTALVGNGLLPVGTVITHAASVAPAGYLKANGATVSRTTYAALFAVIGTTYGSGDGSTTFTLPDLRGEFIRGWDDSRGIDSGRAIGTSQSDAFQGHKHTFDTPAWTGGAGIGMYGTSSSGPIVDNYLSAGTSVGLPKTDGTNGTPRTAGETRPRNISLLACIKY